MLGVTGSVASIKADQLCRELQHRLGEPVRLRVVATEKAKHFLPSLADLPEGVELLEDADEWRWSSRGDPVLHVELTKWADLLLVAPLDCLTLSKLAHGACDNLLSCTLLAWPWGEKPALLCPSMNTRMWAHPATRENWAKVASWPGVAVEGPIAKRLMCGDVGLGAMQEPAAIAQAAKKALEGNCAADDGWMKSALLTLLLIHVTFWWNT